MNFYRLCTGKTFVFLLTPPSFFVILQGNQVQTYIQESCRVSLTDDEATPPPHIHRTTSNLHANTHPFYS